ncbi:recombinase family protein [Burkholderia vietnamiensis]|uniref:recombinase family protein n=1 Tax=Burkholderia vietnamiensis TaxID=60552 RepID=UPI002DD441B1|nr:recombinase family protein [Burkholderia vietnamiensis]MEC4598892.1 recombinase family protein [Burkholderia vietnamiensis]
MARIAYYRVSTRDQSIEAQRSALGGSFDKEFSDNGVSGTVAAMERPGFKACADYLREGDTLHVYAVDRLGRDSIDVQTTVRDLRAKGVTVDVHGLGPIAGDAGELVLTLLAQLAQMERNRIIARTDDGRERAKQSLAATGKTHRGKASLGRPVQHDAEAIAARSWELGSIAKTAQELGISEATVSRARRTFPKTA